MLDDPDIVLIILVLFFLREPFLIIGGGDVLGDLCSDEYTLEEVLY